MNCKWFCKIHGDIVDYYPCCNKAEPKVHVCFYCKDVKPVFNYTDHNVCSSCINAQEAIV